MKKSGLDDLDRSLLAALRVDGRASTAELARQLEVSRATVTSRIDRLVEAGVIVGFTVRTRDAAETVQAMTMVEVHGRNADYVIRQLRGLENVSELYSTNGQWDLIVRLHAGSLAELDQLLGFIRALDGVRRSETSIILSSVLR